MTSLRRILRISPILLPGRTPRAIISFPDIFKSFREKQSFAEITSFVIVFSFSIWGFNKKAKKYINGLSKDIKETIITSPKNTDNIYCLNELRATKLYEILTNKKIYNEEFKIPIIKEG